MHCYSVLIEQLPFFWITLHANKGNINHIYGEGVNQVYSKKLVNDKQMLGCFCAKMFAKKMVNVAI